MEFLVFGEDYNRHPSSTQHLFNEIKKEYFVNWINSIGMRKPSLKKKDCLRVVEKLTGLTKRYPQEALNLDNINIIKPVVYPLAENGLLKIVNNKLLSSKIPKKKSQRILWITLASAVDFIDITDSDLVIYYICDDFTSLEGVDHDVIKAKERELVERADIVFTVSDTLYERFKTPKTFMLTHGVHSAFFDVERKKKESDVIKLGFYGGIDSRVDFNIIKEVLDSDPRYHLEMVGSISDAELIEHERLTISPPKKHSELVDCLNGWDVLLIPFSPSGYATHCNPLKLREYLASGKAIVASPFPALDEYSDYITVAKTNKEWIKGVKLAFEETEQEEVDRSLAIRKIMKLESWEEKKKTALKTIEENL